MVSLTLKNHQSESSELLATIDFSKALCTLTSGQEMPIKEFLNVKNFSHPLLNEPFTPAENHHYHYEYSNMDELLYAGIFVYSRLLRADNPQQCQFKISPSPRFACRNSEASIAFSLQPCKAAQEDISLHQLESIVSDLRGERFDFSEFMVIDAKLSFENLPKTMEAERLYQAEPEILNLLKRPMILEHYELRYVGPSMGFGVYTKVNIAKDEVIALYVGKKVLSDDSDSRYSFKPLNDCLNTSIDAGRWGNLLRFINHAPAAYAEPEERDSSSLLDANLYAFNLYAYGLHFVGYKASQALFPGDQLLVDYGKNYFKKRPMSRFNTKGQLLEVTTNAQLNREMKHKHILCLVKHKVRTARRYLWKKRLLMGGLSTLILLLLLTAFFSQ